jgi:tetratricopeptide (TPR) repeat protein
VVARVLGRDEEAALPRLSGPLRNRHRLVEAVSLERLAWSGQRLSTYRFRHLLLQRSAYDGLDAVERARLHEATGRTLEALYGGEAERPLTLAPELARHYEAAGMRLEAARALHGAGLEAMRLAALRQALDTFNHGLALLADEPPSPERAEIERRLHLAALSPQASLEGTGSSELATALARATDAGAGEEHGRPKLLILQAKIDLMDARGQFEDGLDTAGQMLEEATQAGDEAFFANATYWHGHLHHVMGNQPEADRWFERAIARLTPKVSAELRSAVGFDLTPLALSFSALNQWMLGHPEKALARSTAALTGALEQKDLYGQAFASSISSMILFLLRSDSAALQERAEFAHQLSVEAGFAWWLHYSEAFLGWVAVMAGEPGCEAGIERVQNAIAGWQATGMAVGTDGLLVVLADGCLAAARLCRENKAELRASRLGIALAAMEPFLGPTVLCGQSFQAELCRMRGELLLARDGLGAAAEALACFEQALQLGREQGALAWELRAAMSLVRLRERHHDPRSEAEWEGEGCAAELAQARDSLREVYGRFTEGFALPDLQEAAALIGE